MTADLTIAELKDAFGKLKMKKGPWKREKCSEMIKHLGPAILSLRKKKYHKQKDICRSISFLSCLKMLYEKS